jgi:transcriptional regulator with XRE-family HTH domain
MSQLNLSQQARVSTRHLSFVETGRSEPSRELLMRLSAALSMPARDRNSLLSAAGYQPIYREASWDDPAAAELLHAMKLILRQHEPFGAVALNRELDVIMCNAGFARFLAMLMGSAPAPFQVTAASRLNLLELTFDPDAGVRPFMRNWREVARVILWRARAEVAALRDRRGFELLERLARHPGVAELLDETPEEPGGCFVMPLELEIGGQRLRLFTTMTTLGTPQDLNACELRIEAYHPADEATETLVRALA